MSPEEETQQVEYDDAGPGGPGAPTPLSSLEVSLYLYSIWCNWVMC